MQFRILRPLEVRDDSGRVVALGGRKPRAVLAVLLLNANKPVSVGDLARALYGDDVSESATERVHVNVSRLRKALRAAQDGRITRIPDAGYCLRVLAEELDLKEFERLCEDGRRALATGQARDAARILHEALMMWPGPTLGDVAFEPFADAALTQMEEQRAATVEEWIDAELAAGHHGQVVAELQDLVAASPMRERLVSQLMLALYRCGRQRDALQAYQDAWRRLDSIGVGPGPELRALQQAILRQDITLNPSHTVRFNVPQVVASFIGREQELGQLDAALRDADHAVITQAVTGLGGVGKSQLAARYVEDRGDEYDIVAWIGAEDGGIADLAGLAAQLDVAEPSLPPSELAQLALKHLAHTSRSWLLVLDNVSSPEQLATLRPASGMGRVLVTSRDRTLRQFGPLITVDVFDLDTATKYLIDRADRPGDEPSARRLAAALGCLPLALAHAAAYCQLGTSFTEYHALLPGLPACELFDSQPEQSYEQTVASTWLASITAATDHEPLAAQALELAAYLAPDAIPKTLFAILLDDGSPRSRKRLADAFGALTRYSLAVVEGETISVHRLLQKVVRDAVAAREDRRPGLLALATVDEHFPRDAELPTRWPLCERLLAHAHALADSVSNPADQAMRLVDLLNRTCWYLTRAERDQRALMTATIATECAERWLDVQDPSRVNAREHLALAYDAAGRAAEAIAIYEPLLGDRERSFGAMHPSVLDIRNNLALAYLQVGREADAIAIFERLLEAHKEMLGDAHPATLRSRHNLAVAYHSVGRSTEAVAMYEPLLSDRQQILGVHHPDTLATRHNLGDAYYHVGLFNDAIAILEPLLEDQEQILGADHRDALGTRRVLGMSYMAAGRVTEGISWLESLVSDEERLLGIEHSQALISRYQLASAYCAAGRVTHAIALWEALVDDRQRISGAKASTALWIRVNLAHACVDAGRELEAIAILERVSIDCERILGPDDRETLEIRRDLALAYQKAGRVTDAHAIFEALLSDQERIRGCEHPETLFARSELARSYHAVGRTHEGDSTPGAAG